MTIQMKTLPWAMALLALLSATNLASAYYDPGVQRWINRDPVSERGFDVRRVAAVVRLPRNVGTAQAGEPLNLYGFVGNAPTHGTDLNGLTQWEPPWPGDSPPPPVDPFKCKWGPDPLLKYICFAGCAAAIASVATYLGIGSIAGGHGVAGTIIGGYAICAALCNPPSPRPGSHP